MAGPAKAKKKPDGPAPLGAVRTECFVSGRPLEIVKLSNDMWQVRGDGWVSTKLFLFKSYAEYWVSHNLGVPPAWPDPHVKASLREQPYPEAADEVAGLEKAGQQLASDLSRIATGR